MTTPNYTHGDTPNRQRPGILIVGVGTFILGTLTVGTFTCATDVLTDLIWSREPLIGAETLELLAPVLRCEPSPPPEFDSLTTSALLRPLSVIFVVLGDAFGLFFLSRAARSQALVWHGGGATAGGPPGQTTGAVPVPGGVNGNPGEGVLGNPAGVIIAGVGGAVVVPPLTATVAGLGVRSARL
jgi:hypothetical protein